MTRDQINTKLDAMRRQKNTPVAMIEAFEAIAKVDQSLTDQQKIPRINEIMAETLKRLERKDAA
jgi:hypothetical protein